MSKKSLTQRIGIVLAVVFLLGAISAVAFKLCLKLDRSYGQIDSESLGLISILGTQIENGASLDVLQKELIDIAKNDQRFGDLIIIKRNGTIIAAKNSAAIGKTFAIVFASDRVKGVPVPFTYRQSGYNVHTNPDHIYSFSTDTQYMFNDFGEFKSPNNTSYHLIGNYHVKNNVLVQRNKLIAYGNIFDKTYHICLLSFWLLLPIWVYLDARKHRNNPAAWGILVLFTSVIGWVVYLIARPPTVKCPSCNTEQSSFQKFCTSCGVPLKNCCHQCGSEVRSEWDFCGQCGYKIGS